MYIKCLYMYAYVKALWKFKNVLRMHMYICIYMCFNDKVKDLNGFINVF